jgi:hypothetical protein
VGHVFVEHEVVEVANSRAGDEGESFRELFRAKVNVGFVEIRPLRLVDRETPGELKRELGAAEGGSGAVPASRGGARRTRGRP